ncbi:MAG: hypothetical protein J5675_03370 [Bacteroidales bacterium]|nr:hypothetical protein [Bacteroidales bacterium]
MKKHLLILFAVFAAFVSCTKDDKFTFPDTKSSGTTQSWETPQRVESKETRNVLLLYSAGFNTLANYLDNNITQLTQGVVPAKTNRGDHILLVYSKLTARNDYGRVTQDFSQPTSSALFRIYQEEEKVIMDTLKVWGPEANACDPETMSSVLNFVHDTFPAKGYGMIFSSHATGWLPSGYYNDPNKFEGQSGDDVWSAPSLKWMRQNEYPPLGPDQYPAVKSIGQDNIPNNSLEMELDQFAQAIPFRLDYLLLDACLCGCVEVAYELRGKADIVGFSQTEVLAEGFNYTTLGGHLLKDNPDPIQVCKDYFDYYDTYLERNPGAGSSYRSATISVVDTREMEPLADICKTLFEKYRKIISTMNSSRVQGYFRYNRHFYYDLQDILVKAGIDQDEAAQLQNALDQCVIYKAATDIFLSITINTACGFSMYLPANGSKYLDKYYTSRLAWNRDTELVK